MHNKRVDVRCRMVRFLVGVSCGLILLAALAGCVTVSGQSASVGPTVDALRQDLQLLQVTVTAMDARLQRLEITPQPTVTSTPVPPLDLVTWTGGGVALSYSPTITPAIALYPAPEIHVFSNVETFLSEWITPATTIQLALLSPISDTYTLLAVESLNVGSPTGWHIYSTVVVTPTGVITTAPYNNILLGTALSISQTTSFADPANQDLGGSLQEISETGYDLTTVKYAQLLLLDQSGQSSRAVVAVIHPDAPGGGDRIKQWCQKSCRFRWCAWFCRLLR